MRFVTHPKFEVDENLPLIDMQQVKIGRQVTPSKQLDIHRAYPTVMSWIASTIVRQNRQLPPNYLLPLWHRRIGPLLPPIGCIDAA